MFALLVAHKFWNTYQVTIKISMFRHGIDFFFEFASVLFISMYPIIILGVFLFGFSKGEAILLAILFIV